VSRRRRALIVLAVIAGLGLALVGLHDLVLYRALSVAPVDYCRVSEDSASERQLAPGDLTTSEADSGCRTGEVHLCGYPRIVLAEVIEERQPPC
jgi:hypothetical protein